MIMGDIVTFIPQSNVKISFGKSYITADEDRYITPTLINSNNIASYEWKEGSRIVGKKKKLSTKVLSQGEHLLVLTVTDKNGLTVSEEIMVIKIGYAYLAQQYLMVNVFELGVTFDINKHFTPLSNPDYKTMVVFGDDNTMYAVVDCSEFTADYIVKDYGIFFSNITREPIEDLECLYTEYEDNFEKIIKKGIYFNNAVDDENIVKSNFNPEYELFPNLDLISSIEDFDFDDFVEKLNRDTYTDSPLMNSLFKTESTYGYMHVKTSMSYRFNTPPKIKIIDKSIHIDLLDATFDADIVVIDATHIKFKNITRNNIADVVYPEPYKCESEHEEECEFPYMDNYYSDATFRAIIDKFLHEKIKVSLATTDYTMLELRGSKFKLNTTQESWEPPVEPLALLFDGDDVTESSYDKPKIIVLPNKSKKLFSVTTNKSTTISIAGKDRKWFIIKNNILSFKKTAYVSKPKDNNKDGIYEISLSVTDEDDQYISYPLYFKLPIPGTKKVSKLSQMKGVWDFNNGRKPYVLEYLADGKVNIHTYDNVNSCYESDISALSIKKDKKKYVFRKYNSNTKTYIKFTAEVNNSNLYQTMGKDIVPSFIGLKSTITMEDINSNQCY